MVLWKTLARLTPCLVASLFMICSVGALCQNAGGAPPTNPQSQSEQNQPDQNQHSGKTSSSAKDGGSDSNAFPMSQSEAAAKAASNQTDQQNQQSAPQTTSPHKTGSSKDKSSASQDNPFPEAQSKAAARTDNGARNTQGSGDTAESGNTQKDSSSSGVGYSSSDANLPPADLGQEKPGTHSKLDSFTRDQTQDGRIEDDLKVADLYMKNGNYRGALMRYQDTLQYDPQNDTALFGMADAMCRQNQTAEAMARFKSYTKDHPQGKYAIKAEKMLAHPNKCMHNW